MLLHEGRVALTPLTEALLFIAGRVQLVEEQIRPALAKGRIVVCDRFHDSTIAYQGFGGGLETTWLDAIGRRAVGGLMPDLTILLDVAPSVGFSRLRRRHDRMERKAPAFHRRVRRGFLRLAASAPRRCVIVDASQPAALVRQQILVIVRKRLRQHWVLAAAFGSIVVIAFVAGLIYWLNIRNYESTDDAFVAARSQPPCADD